MNTIIKIITITAAHNVILAKDSTTIRFIKCFIENEQRPTYLIYKDICWSKSFQVKLASEVSKIGFRSSPSFEAASKHQDDGVLFLFDLSCPGSEVVIRNTSSRNLFGFPYRWLILSDDENLSVLDDIPIYVDSDVVLSEKIDNGYKMNEIHKPSNTSTIVFTTRGYYNGSFHDVRPHRQLFRRRRDLLGSPITMANVIQDSNNTQLHIEMEDRLELQYDVVARICWMSVKLAFQMLNATPRHIFSHRWGYKRDGRWSGMINDLYENNADIGTNCLTDIERLKVITYTDMLAPFRVRFIFRQPPLSYVSNIFSLPFSTSVWIAITVCAAVSTVALFFASKWEMAASERKGPTQLDGIGDALLLTMSAVSQQGCFLEPRRLSGRIMLWIMFAALMALYAAYSANIVVLLQAPSNSIRTLAQLASSKITLAANDVDYNHFVFSQYNDPVRVTIYKKIEPGKGKGQFYDIAEGTQRVRQGLFAFHGIVEPVYRRIEETFLESEKCDLVEIDFMNSFDPFVPVRKKSPYIELLRVVFKQIRESGLQSALNRRLQTPKPHCSSHQAAFSSVGLLDLRPVLLLMLYGTALSVAIMVLEILVFKLSKNLRKTSLH